MKRIRVGKGCCPDRHTLMIRHLRPVIVKTTQVIAVQTLRPIFRVGVRQVLSHRPGAGLRRLDSAKSTTLFGLVRNLARRMKAEERSF